MSLYQSINNEALDEDRNADRVVLERLKKNYLDNTEKIQPNSTFDGVRKTVFKQNISLFEKYIYKLFGYIASRNVYKYQGQPFELNLGEVSTILADIVIAYNVIVVYLKKIKYNNLMQNDKQYIDKVLSGYVPLLNKIETDLEKIIPDNLLLPISNIKNDILLKNYSIVPYLGEDTKEVENIVRRRDQIGVPFTKKDLEGEEETKEQARQRRQERKEVYEGLRPPRVVVPRAHPVMATTATQAEEEEEEEEEEDPFFARQFL